MFSPEFTGEDLPKFLEKLNNNEITLENILEEEEIIDDIKNNSNSQFINILTNENIKKLIDYSIKIPASDDPKIGYKFPFNATEILCSDNRNFQNIFMKETPFIIHKEVNEEDKTSLRELRRQAKNIRKDGFISALFNIINKIKKEKEKELKMINSEENEIKEKKENIFVNDDSDDDDEEEEDNLDKEEDNKENQKPKFIYENVDYLLSFLKESEETKENYVLVGYFYKILNSLINIHSTKIIQYLFDYPKKKELDILRLFIKHMSRKSMCNIIYKLLVFEGEINTKFEDKKLNLMGKILDELNETNDKIKYDCICDSLCLVMNNTYFFNLFITKLDLLEKLYNILFDSIKNNTKKVNSLLKLLIKINENILKGFEVHYTSNVQENNNDLNLYNIETCYSNDQDKSNISRGDNLDILKNALFLLFDILEKKILNIFEDLGNSDEKENDEFKSTYMEKQKKIGMKKIIETEYLQTVIDIMVNSYASKYYDTKLEKIIEIAKNKNIFWNLHDIFFMFPFSNIYQIYYSRIFEIVLSEFSPNFLVEAFFVEFVGEKRNLIDLYIEKIIKDMKFVFNITKAISLSPCFSILGSLLDKIYNSPNIHVKKMIENNKDFSVFYEVIGKEISEVFNQKLLLSNGLDFGDSDEDRNLNYFGIKSFLELFNENCSIYETYKKGGNYQKLLSDKKERIEKERSEKRSTKEKIVKNIGIEYIDDLGEEDDDPFGKIEKYLNKNKENNHNNNNGNENDANNNNDNDNDNFLSILNKPKEEIVTEDTNENKNNNYETIDNDNNNDNENINDDNVNIDDNINIKDYKVSNNDEEDNVNIYEEMEKLNEDSLPNQVENKIYHVKYNENKKIK